MTDRYARIRDALKSVPTPGPYEIYQVGGRFYVETTTRQSRCGVFKALGSPESERRANAKLAAACDPDTIRALLDERDALREALALLPDEIVMVEHNPDEGPLMFCCGRKVTLSWRHDLIPTHDEECWYARMRAMRDRDQEDRND